MGQQHTRRGKLLCLLLLVSSCDGVDDDADDTVTAQLPRATSVMNAPVHMDNLRELRADHPSQRDVQRAATPAEERVFARSRYTPLEPSTCALVDSPAAEADLSRRRCEGPGGYALETIESEGRQQLAVITPEGKRSELDVPGVSSAGTLGRVAEWRGTHNGRPRALIVRISVPTNKPPISTLVVAKLDGQPCIVAVIGRGSHQNEKAQAVADGKQLKCKVP